MHILGDSLDKIAAEKAGIIKLGAPPSLLVRRRKLLRCC
ncbi:dihydrofolate synthase [Cutibacterium acnes JCM 18918]|nr:dihydrofolate synthase [Cutibacterium acnes JCM 18918]